MLSLSACHTDSQKDGLSVHFLVRQLISLNLAQEGDAEHRAEDTEPRG